MMFREIPWQELQAALKAVAALSESAASLTAIATLDTMELMRTVTTRCATDADALSSNMLQSVGEVLSRVAAAEQAGAVAVPVLIESGNVKKLLSV